MTQLIPVACMYKVLIGLLASKPCDKLSGNTNIGFKRDNGKAIDLKTLEKLRYFFSCRDFFMLSVSVAASDFTGSICVEASDFTGSICVEASDVTGSIFVEASDVAGSICVEASDVTGSICVEVSGVINPGSVQVSIVFRTDV